MESVATGNTGVGAAATCALTGVSAMVSWEWNLASLRFEDFDAGFELTDAFGAVDEPDDALNALFTRLTPNPEEVLVAVRMDHNYCTRNKVNNLVTRQNVTAVPLQRHARSLLKPIIPDDCVVINDAIHTDLKNNNITPPLKSNNISMNHKNNNVTVLKNNNVTVLKNNNVTVLKKNDVTVLKINSTPTVLKSNNITTIDRLQTKAEVKVFDPIALATKKALRLKELATKKTNIDDIITSKIPKVDGSLILPMVTENGKLLPMIKEVGRQESHGVRLRPEGEKKELTFVEIVLVSVGVGTADTDNCNSEKREHGEDKVIMHLPKDAVRPLCSTVAVQTEEITECATVDESNNHFDVQELMKLSIQQNDDTYSELAQKQTRKKRRNSKFKLRKSIDDNSSDTESVNMSPSNSKRKRNPSISHLANSWRPPSKLCREYDKSSDSAIDNRDDEESEASSRHRSSSISSNSSHDSSSSSSSSSGSDSDSDSDSTSTDGYSSSSSVHTRTEDWRRSEDSQLNKKEVKTEERKIIYVGMLEPRLSVSELKMKFVKYGHVVEVTIHTKDDGMRYGFVTFARAEQTYKVLENASKDSDISHYDVFFGGRRSFCRQVYADLDELEEMQEESEYYPSLVSRALAPKVTSSFDDLLRKAKAVVHSRRIKDHRLYSVNYDT